jgi:26S proteasome regulatory subunit N1
MTYSDTQPRGTLRYRLLSAPLRPSDSPLSDPGTWGHEYVRHLSAELAEEFTAREEASLPQPTSTQEVEPKTQLPGTIDDLRDLARQCAKFLLSHNAEPDAVDLFEEMEIIGDIADLVDENTYGRVCQYMIRYANAVLILLMLFLIFRRADA